MTQIEQLQIDVSNIQRELLEIITRDELDSAVVKEKLRPLIEEASSIIAKLESVKHKSSCFDHSLTVKIKISGLSLPVHRQIKTSMTFTFITAACFTALVLVGDNRADKKVHMILQVFNKNFFLSLPVGYVHGSSSLMR